MRPLRVVVRSVGREDPAQVSLPEDQHRVGDFVADGQHEAFGESAPTINVYNVRNCAPDSFGGRPGTGFAREAAKRDYRRRAWR